MSGIKTRERAFTELLKALRVWKLDTGAIKARNRLVRAFNRYEKAFAKAPEVRK